MASDDLNLKVKFTVDTENLPKEIERLVTKANEKVAKSVSSASKVSKVPEPTDDRVYRGPSSARGSAVKTREYQQAQRDILEGFSGLFSSTSERNERTIRENRRKQRAEERERNVDLQRANQPYGRQQSRVPSKVIEDQFKFLQNPVGPQRYKTKPWDISDDAVDQMSGAMTDLTDDLTNNGVALRKETLGMKSRMATIGGAFENFTKRWRSGLTGVLIDLHALRIVGQSSRVVSAMFEVMSKSIGYVIDMALIPALPWIIGFAAETRKAGHWLASLNPVLKFLISRGVLLVGGSLIMLNTVKSLYTAYKGLQAWIIAEKLAHKTLALTIDTTTAAFRTLLAALAPILAILATMLIFKKVADRTKEKFGSKIDAHARKEHPGSWLSKPMPRVDFRPITAAVLGENIAYGGMSGFASGGLLKSGQAAVVGEKGPELLIPGSGGYNVVPNHGLRFLAEGTGDGILSTLLDSIGGLGDWLGTEIKNVMDGVGGFVGGIFSKSISGGGVDTGVGTTLGDSQKAIMSKGFATQNAISSSGFKNANTLLAAILAALMQGLKGAGGETPEVTPEPVDASSIWELIGIPIPKLASDIWNLVTKVVDVLSTKLWNLVLSPVTYVSSQLWKLVEPVAKIIPFPWTLGSLAETTVKWPWALQEPGTVTVKFPWTLAIPIVETIAFPWKLGSPTTTEVSFPWRLQEPTPDPILSTSLWILQKVLETVNSNSLWSLVLSPQSFLSSQIWSLTLPTTKEVISALDLATVEAPAAPKTFQASDLWQLLVIPQQFFSDQIWQVMLSAPLPITTDMIVDLRHIDPDEIADDWLDAFKAKKPQFNLAGEPGSDAIIIIERKSFWGDAMEIPVPVVLTGDQLFTPTPAPTPAETFYPVTPSPKKSDDLYPIIASTKLALELFTVTPNTLFATDFFGVLRQDKSSNEFYNVVPTDKTASQLFNILAVNILGTALFSVTPVTKLATDFFGVQNVIKTASEFFNIAPVVKATNEFFNIHPLPAVGSPGSGAPFEWDKVAIPVLAAAGVTAILSYITGMKVIGADALSVLHWGGTSLPVVSTTPGIGIIYANAMRLLDSASGSGDGILHWISKNILGGSGTGSILVQPASALKVLGTPTEPAVISWDGQPKPAISDGTGGLIQANRRGFWGDILTNFSTVNLWGGLISGNFPLALIGGLISLTGFVDAVKEGVKQGAAAAGGTATTTTGSGSHTSVPQTYTSISKPQDQGFKYKGTANINGQNVEVYSYTGSGWYAKNSSGNLESYGGAVSGISSLPAATTTTNPTAGSTATQNPSTTVSNSNPTISGSPLPASSSFRASVDGDTATVYTNVAGTPFINANGTYVQVYPTGAGNYTTRQPSSGGGSGGGGSGGDSSPVTISNPVVTTTPAPGYNWLAYDGGKKYGMTRTPDGDDASLVEITTEQFKNQILERANTPVYSNKSGTGTNLNAWPKSVIFPYSSSVINNSPTKKLFFLQTERIGGITTKDKVAAYPSGSNWTLNLQQQPYLNEWVDYKLWKTVSSSDLYNVMGGTASERIPGLALGGRAISAGLAWVGERGRELMALPKGAEVMPHTPSMDLLAKQTKPQVVDKSVHYNFDGAVFQVSGKDERQLFEEFMRMMERESRRVRG